MAVQKREVIIKDIKEIFDFTVKLWTEIADEAIAKRKRFTVALSGGRTPVELYKNLALSKYALPWDKTHVFLVDERFVPLEYPDSNYGMIKENLIDHIDIPEENIHIVTIEKNPQISAKKYEESMKKFFQGEPQFDLIMLGIGEDGHTASLFPENRALEEKVQFVINVRYCKVKYERISITFPVINNARNVMFLVTGENKSSILKEVLTSKNLPASMVRLANGKVYFVLDENAGLLLTK